MLKLIFFIFLHISNGLLFSRLLFKRKMIYPKKKVGIIFFPGFGKKSSCYEDICNILHNELDKSNINSEILIQDYFYNIPILGNLQTEYLTKKAIKTLNEKNITNIFFIGHSAGSYFLNDVAKKYGNGFIQMGNVLNSDGVLPWNKISLNNYPIPTLTLLGQKDGYTKFLLALDELNDIRATNNTILKPVIIEKNVNHLQMCDNIKSTYAPLLNKKDINSPIEIKHAHESLSVTICEFIKCCTLKNYKSDILLSKIKNTENLLVNYNETSSDLDGITRLIQFDVLQSLNLEYLEVINNYYKNNADFIKSKPKVNNTVINICSHINERKLSSEYYSNYIWLKLKNPSHFNNRNIKLKEASEFNKEIFYKVLNNEKTTSEIKKGPNIIFEKDIIFDNGILIGVNWITSKIKINFNETINTLYVKSPVLISSSDVPNEKFANMYYMKILSPQLCYELIHLYF